jgi:2-iminobutanoate/2-iminopropanoate deaminase
VRSSWSSAPDSQQGTTNDQQIASFQRSIPVGKQIVTTTQAPAAIGPYSQAVRSGNLVFVSGQIPLDPATGQLVEGGIEPQAERVLKNLAAILEAAGSGLDRALKVTVYLRDLEDFARLNEVYARYFPAQPPARATVEVRRLPRDVAVEMDVIAEVG